jgi:guanylate kinase
MAIYASAIPHFRKLGFRSLKPIYVMPPSYVEWMRRIGGVRTQDILARIHEARESVNLALADSSYHFVLNDTLDLAVSEVRSIMNNEAVNEHRAQLARDTADIILERIGDTELVEPSS